MTNFQVFDTVQNILEKNNKFTKNKRGYYEQEPKHFENLKKSSPKNGLDTRSKRKKN